MNAQRRLSLQLQPTSQQKSRRSSLAATATPTTTGKRSRRGSMVADEIIVEQEVVEEQVEQVVQDESVAVVVDQQPEQQVLTTAVPEEVLPVQAVVLQQDAPVEQEVKRRRAWDVRDSPEDQAAKLQSIRAAFMSNAASAVPCTPLVANNSLRRSVQAMPRPSPLRTVAVPMAVSPTPTPNDNREFAVLQARYTALEAELAATVRARDAAEAEAARLRQTVTELRQQLQQHQQPALQIQQIQPPVRTNSNNGVTTSASTASTATNSGAVRVYCRVRPPLPNEVELSADHRLVVSAQKITVVRGAKNLCKAHRCSRRRATLT
jgi:hypothetical protein